MLVLFKLTTYCLLNRTKKTSGELSFGRGETDDFELGRNDSRRNGPVSNDRNSEVII